MANFVNQNQVFDIAYGGEAHAYHIEIQEEKQDGIFQQHIYFYAAFYPQTVSFPLLFKRPQQDKSKHNKQYSYYPRNRENIIKNI